VSDKIEAGLKLEEKKVEELAQMLGISKQSMSNKFYRGLILIPIRNMDKDILKMPA
jgi:hypothetical protein